MIRIVLCGCIVAGCASLGSAVALGQARRARVLAELMDAIQILHVHMLERGMPVRTALGMSGCRTLRSIGEKMSEGISAACAWHAAERELNGRGNALDSLTDRDVSVLDAFFEGMGESARAEQEQRFQTVIREIGRLEEEARTAKNRHGRLYTSLGVLFGLIVVIATL